MQGKNNYCTQLRTTLQRDKKYECNEENQNKQYSMKKLNNNESEIEHVEFLKTANCAISTSVVHKPPCFAAMGTSKETSDRKARTRTIERNRPIRAQRVNNFNPRVSLILLLPFTELHNRR